MQATNREQLLLELYLRIEKGHPARELLVREIFPYGILPEEDQIELVRDYYYDPSESVLINSSNGEYFEEGKLLDGLSSEKALSYALSQGVYKGMNTKTYLNIKRKELQSVAIDIWDDERHNESHDPDISKWAKKSLEFTGVLCPNVIDVDSFIVHKRDLKSLWHLTMEQDYRVRREDPEVYNGVQFKLYVYDQDCEEHLNPFCIKETKSGLVLETKEYPHEKYSGYSKFRRVDPINSKEERDALYAFLEFMFPEDFPSWKPQIDKSLNVN